MIQEDIERKMADRLLRVALSGAFKILASSDIRDALFGALKSAINDHGPIDKDLMESVYKRFRNETAFRSKKRLQYLCRQSMDGISAESKDWKTEINELINEVVSNRAKELINESNQTNNQ